MESTHACSFVNEWLSGAAIVGGLEECLWGRAVGLCQDTRARKAEDWPDAGSRGPKILKMWGARTIQEMREQIKRTAQLKTAFRFGIRSASGQGTFLVNNRTPIYVMGLFNIVM